LDLAEEAERVDAVIASFDRTLVYRKLQMAFDAIRARALFFATNTDRYCPVPGGGEPDGAASIATIEAGTNTWLEAVVGKPSHHMIETAPSLMALPAADCPMSEGRLDTDVPGAQQAGLSGLLLSWCWICWRGRNMTIEC
jgi:NagD protein